MALHAQPLAIRHGFVPSDPDDRQLRIGEPRFGAKWCRGSAACFDKDLVLAVCHRIFPDVKTIQRDAMRRPLVFLTSVTAHEKPSFRNHHEIRNYRWLHEVESNG